MCLICFRFYTLGNKLRESTVRPARKSFVSPCAPIQTSLRLPFLSYFRRSNAGPDLFADMSKIGPSTTEMGLSAQSVACCQI